MSAHGKEARPGRCYCRVHDEGVSLNDIAKIIAALNHKILCIRNEVNAFKNVGANGERRSSEESAHGHLSAPYYETEPDISRSNTQLEGRLDPEAAVVHMIPFQTQSIINYQLREKVNNEVLAGILKNGVNGNLYSNLVYKKLPKDRKKKISRGVQCDPTRQKRIRYFLNWFKTELVFVKDIFLKRNKETGSEVEPGDKTRNKGCMFTSVYPENSEDNEDFQEDFEEDALNGTIDWTYEAVEIEQNGDSRPLDQLNKIEENKMFKIGLRQDKDTLQKDEGNAHLELECSMIQSMDGGTEFNRNRLISNFNDKIQKICLYKNVKFDAKNVKRRLDACIAELNEIIKNVTLIFPNSNPSEGLRY